MKNEKCRMKNAHLPIVSAGTLSLLVMLAGNGIAETDNCIECHSLVNEEVVTAFQGDVHSRAGLSCADCHGGNPALDDESGMDKRYGFVGAPKPVDIPLFCGKCHSDPTYMRAFNPSLPTDQVEKYWTSRHGQLLKKKDPKVATCASCHKSHGIEPANATNSTVFPLNVPETCGKCHADADYMKPYGIPTDQFAQYTDSLNVHGQALFVKLDMSAPVCNDCHGNHGAVPPGVENIGGVCMQCHSHNGELFRNSPHKEAFDAMELSECAFCHQQAPDFADPHARIHTIVRPEFTMIGTDERALCSQCHSEGDGGWQTAVAIRGLRDSLEVDLDSARALLHDVERKGFEISDARWTLDSEVRQATMELRTVIHAFNREAYLPVFEKADTSISKVLEAGRHAYREVGGRRMYFYLITILIGILVLALWLKLREMEKKN